MGQVLGQTRFVPFCRWDKPLAELTSGPGPYHRQGWIYELKYDGYRMLASHHGDQASIVSRRGNDSPFAFRDFATIPASVRCPGRPRSRVRRCGARFASHRAANGGEYEHDSSDS